MQVPSLRGPSVNPETQPHMQLTVELPDQQYEALQAAASAAGQTEEQYAAQLIQRALQPPPPPLRRASTKKITIMTPIVGLVEGLLFGDTTVGKALETGNFGLGTLNGLDGELMILDGQAYQLTAEGASIPVPPTALSPFMCTTSFDKATAKCLELPHPRDWAGLQLALTEEFPSSNIFYAVLVEGSFERIKARAVRKQTRGRPLAAVAKEQVVFEFADMEGCLVGFWSPAYMGHTLTVPGFHLHFLSADRQRGGHVLDASMRRGTAYIQPVYLAVTAIPKSLEFLKADLTRDPTEDLEAAEK